MKKSDRDSRLIPMVEFEEVVKRVLKAPKKDVDRKLAEVHTKNKARRVSRQAR